jgi:hypothetical protein
MSSSREKEKVERRTTPEEVLYIFDKVLEGWKTIKIYNVMKQERKETQVTKKDVECIATGNVKIYKHEMNQEGYQLYEEKRKQVYDKLK